MTDYSNMKSNELTRALHLKAASGNIYARECLDYFNSLYLDKDGSLKKPEQFARVYLIKALQSIDTDSALDDMSEEVNGPHVRKIAWSDYFKAFIQCEGYLNDARWYFSIISPDNIKGKNPSIIFAKTPYSSFKWYLNSSYRFSPKIIELTIDNGARIYDSILIAKISNDITVESFVKDYSNKNFDSNTTYTIKNVSLFTDNTTLLFESN